MSARDDEIMRAYVQYRIRGWRDRGLTQTRIGAMFGVSKTWVIACERGKLASATAPIQRALAKAEFGGSLDALRAAALEYWEKRGKHERTIQPKLRDARNWRSLVASAVEEYEYPPPPAYYLLGDTRPAVQLDLTAAKIQSLAAALWDATSREGRELASTEYADDASEPGDSATRSAHERS